MTGLFTKIAAAITALTLLGTNPGTALDNLNGLVQQPGDTAFADSEELTAPVDSALQVDNHRLEPRKLP